MKTIRRIGQSFLLSSGLLIPALTSYAATDGFIVPSFRGTANSETGSWEVFSVAAGSPGNLADQPGATTGAVLTQLSPNGFLTGSGNIYNFTDASSFSLADTTPFNLGTVVLQTRTVGSELNYASMTLSYFDGGGSHSITPWFRLETDRTAENGFNVSSLWQWDLTGLGINSYVISFAGAESSMSFDSLTLDTCNQFTAVPEPSAATLASIAAVCFLIRSRTARGRGKTEESLRVPAA